MLKLTALKRMGRAVDFFYSDFRTVL